MIARRPTAVVAGALAQRPGVAGHAWVFVNWLAGLRDAGYDVVFVDRLDPEMLDCPDQPVETSRQMAWLRRVMCEAGLRNDQVAVLHDGGRSCWGMNRDDLLERCRQASVLLNVMGYIDDPEVLGSVERRVFLDIDPGFGQFWLAMGQADVFAGHDVIASVGLNLCGSGCTVPPTALTVVTTLPPVALSRWPDAGPLPLPSRARATSVCTWRGPLAPVEHEGNRYGLRVHELRRFASLPGALAGVDLELALAIDPADAADDAGLVAGGWQLVDPNPISADLHSYGDYIRGSSMELMIAKEMYVRSQSGWFSDRSVCYLASGRPVVAQDTGFSRHLPTGEGLLAIRDVDEAAAAIEEVDGNWAHHAKAARALAVDLFDASVVVTSLLERVGVA